MEASDLSTVDGWICLEHDPDAVQWALLCWPMGTALFAQTFLSGFGEYNTAQVEMFAELWYKLWWIQVVLPISGRAGAKLRWNS